MTRNVADSAVHDTGQGAPPVTARSLLRGLVVLAILAVVAALLPAASFASPTRGGADRGRFLVVAKSGADYGALKARALKTGAKVVREVPQLGTLVADASASARSSLAADSHTSAVAADHVEKISQAEPPKPNLAAPGLRGAHQVAQRARAAAPSADGITPDPAFGYQGLQWDYGRIGLPQGWNTTAGSPDVTVGVADTGVDFTHAELASKVTQVVDFTADEDPPLCKTFFGVSDQDLAMEYGGPATTDWNGHGSWIGGNIAAALDGGGINGIAPKVGLVALKISQWCGAAFDSTILDAFVTAADLGIDVVSISFGGYLDRSDPDQNAVYRAYVAAVRYARSRGTIIVASAGNEHVRVGGGGKVLTHGSLTAPGFPVEDLFGQYEVPGGVRLVVDVSSTGNLVNASSESCEPGTVGSADDLNATCKPAGDAHQAAGQGKQDQLSYFSNYGPRIDLAAPGGARKFNLPFWDRGGTPGFPYTDADGTNVWEDFSTTSNWAVLIPCFVFPAGSGFPENQCYTAIQGTSMAAPHASAALALIASAHASLRHRPSALAARLKAITNHKVHNLTKVTSARDTSAADLDGGACPTGYCHLGGARISDRDAYGRGLVNVAKP
jgi:lantibiotic leader peptide-processing serine protease